LHQAGQCRPGIRQERGSARYVKVNGAMTSTTLFGRSLVLLATLATGAAVTAAVVADRRSSAPQPTTAQDAVMMVRQPPDASRPSEAPATAPAAAAIALPVIAPAPPPRPAIAVPAVAPAPPAADATQPETGALAQEVQQLRDELARLKHELAEARVDSQAAVLQDMDRHLVALRAQLAANQAEHEEESVAAQSAAAQRHEAVQMLFAAQRRLAIGNADVRDSLDAATPALPYPAQTALRNARDRLESEDLYGARYWIGVAILESGWSQLVQ
jgi:type IV secretory pathway VirB10-like protein